MSHAPDEKSIKTAKIDLPSSHGTRIRAIVATAIAAIAVLVAMSAKVSWNSSSAQSTGSGSAAAANTTLGPGGTHTCTPDDVGKVIGCVATATPPAVLVDPDTDSDGILDSVDQCVNAKEDVDGVEDDDGCPELTDGERIAILEKQMKGQKGQWDAIGDLRGRMTTAEKKIEALRAWQSTVNTSLKVATERRRIEQVNEVYMLNGRVATAAQVKKFLEKMEK